MNPGQYSYYHGPNVYAGPPPNMSGQLVQYPPVQQSPSVPVYYAQQPLPQHMNNYGPYTASPSGPPLQPPHFMVPPVQNQYMPHSSHPVLLNNTTPSHYNGTTPAHNGTTPPHLNGPPMPVSSMFDKSPVRSHGWSTMVSAPSPNPAISYSKSSVSPGLQIPSQLPPRLKLLGEHCKQTTYEHNIMGEHSTNAFFTAASNHGIIIQRSDPIITTTTSDNNVTTSTAISDESWKICWNNSFKENESSRNESNSEKASDFTAKATNSTIVTCGDISWDTGVSKTSAKLEGIGKDKGVLNYDNIIKTTYKNKPDIGESLMGTDDTMDDIEAIDNEDPLSNSNSTGLESQFARLRRVRSESSDFSIEEHEFLCSQVEFESYEDSESESSESDQDSSDNDIDETETVETVGEPDNEIQEITGSVNHANQKEVLDCDPHEIQNCDSELISDANENGTFDDKSEQENDTSECAKYLKSIDSDSEDNIVVIAKVANIPEKQETVSDQNLETIEDQLEIKQDDLGAETMENKEKDCENPDKMTDTEHVFDDEEKHQIVQSLSDEKDASNTLHIANKSSEKEEDFEKFFFKRTASRHGILIESPKKDSKLKKMKSETDSDEEIQTNETVVEKDPYEHLFTDASNNALGRDYHRSDQHSVIRCSSVPLDVESCGGGRSEMAGIIADHKIVFRSRQSKSEDIDSDSLHSWEGSQNEKIDAFKMKALQRGISIQDPRDGSSGFSTDTELELELAGNGTQVRRKGSELERIRRCSTPDQQLPELNPESPEFKPSWKKKFEASSLRPDAKEFNSDSLNSSISSIEFTDKSESNIRVNAPEFVPGKISQITANAAEFHPKEKVPAKSKIFYIPTPKEKKPNPSVSTQASPTCVEISVGTRNIKTKESGIVTMTCDNRDVCVNTDETCSNEQEGDIVRRPTVKYLTKSTNTDRKAKHLTKSTNTDLKQKRSVGINVQVRTRLPEKTDKGIMTDIQHRTDLPVRLSPSKPTEQLSENETTDKKLMAEKIRKLQTELMQYKEREVLEKLAVVKVNLNKNMAAILPMFTQGVEADMLQSMIHSKMAMVDLALAQVKEITQTTLTHINNGETVCDLPEFKSIIPEMSMSPTKRFASPQRPTETSQSWHGISSASPQCRSKTSQSWHGISSTSPPQCPSKASQSWHGIWATGSSPCGLAIPVPTHVASASSLTVQTRPSVTVSSVSSVNVTPKLSTQIHLPSSPATTRSIQFPNIDVSSIHQSVSQTQSPSDFITKETPTHVTKHKHSSPLFAKVSKGSLSEGSPESLNTSIVDTVKELQELKKESPVKELLESTDPVEKSHTDTPNIDIDKVGKSSDSYKADKNLCLTEWPELKTCSAVLDSLLKRTDATNDDSFAESVKELQEIKPDRDVLPCVEMSVKSRKRSHDLMDIEDSEDEDSTDKDDVCNTAEGETAGRGDDETTALDKPDDTLTNKDIGCDTEVKGCDLGCEVKGCASLNGINDTEKEQEAIIDETDRTHDILRDYNSGHKEVTVIGQVDNDMNCTTVKDTNQKITSETVASTEEMQEDNLNVNSPLKSDTHSNYDSAKSDLEEDHDTVNEFDPDSVGHSVSEGLDPGNVGCSVSDGPDPNNVGHSVFEGLSYDDVGHSVSEGPDADNGGHSVSEGLDPDNVRHSVSDKLSFPSGAEDEDSVKNRQYEEQESGFEKMIREKMCAAYKENTFDSRKDKSPLKGERNGSLDDIDDDPCDVIEIVDKLDEESDKTNLLKYLAENSPEVRQEFESVPAGFDVDPKEVFMSPEKKPSKRFLEKQMEVAKEQITIDSSVKMMVPKTDRTVAMPVPQTLQPSGAVESSHMPLMMSSVDPILYQAVLTQLVNVYPELATNAEMLTNLATQQTGLVQMYYMQGSGGQTGYLEQAPPVTPILGPMGAPGIPDLMNVGGNLGPQNNQPNIQSYQGISSMGSICGTNQGNKIKPAPGLPEANTGTKSNTTDTRVENGQESISKDNPKLKMTLTEKNAMPPSRPPGFCQKSDVSANIPVGNIGEKSLKQLDKKQVTEKARRMQEPENKPLEYMFEQKVDTSLRNENSNHNAIPAETSISQADFMPDFAKRHKPAMTRNSAVHHFQYNVDEQVTRSIASSDIVNFERKTPSPPIPSVVTYELARTEDDFPALKKETFPSVSRKPDVPVLKKEDFPALRRPETQNVVRQRNQSGSSSGDNSGYKQPDKSFYIPPGRRRKSSRDEISHDPMEMQSGSRPYLLPTPTVPSAGFQELTRSHSLPLSKARNQPAVPRPNSAPFTQPRNQSSARTRSSSGCFSQPVHQSTGENWNDEVDDYSDGFTLHHDPNRNITMTPVPGSAPVSANSSITMDTKVKKNKTADETNPFIAPADKSIPAPTHRSMSGLCEIELPKPSKTEEKEECKEPVEEWCEVQPKRKRHHSKEQQKELRKYSAPYVNTASLPSSNKATKQTNFERLLGRMKEEFPDAERQELINAVTKIRENRGSLSGLNMENILEQAHAFITTKPKVIPGLWANPKKPQKLNLPPRFQAQANLEPTEGANENWDEDICVICHDGLTTEPTKELDCRHVFHSQCISRWVERERTCPTCRKLALFPEEFPRLGK